MMAAILNSAILDSDTAILDSDTLLSSLRFTQKHSHSTLTLTQTNSIWLKLIHSHSTWWWQPSWILPSWIRHCHLGFSHLVFPLKLTHTCQIGSHICTKKTHSFILTQLDDGSHLNLPCWNLTKKTSFILTQLDDGSHLEFCHLEFGHLGFSHLSISLKLTHTCQDWFPPFAQKTSLIHSDSTWWWQPSWILPCWIQPHLPFSSTWWWQPSWILPCWIQTHLGFRHLVIFSQIHSKTLSLHSDSDSN